LVLVTIPCRRIYLTTLPITPCLDLIPFHFRVRTQHILRPLAFSIHLIANHLYSYLPIKKEPSSPMKRESSDDEGQSRSDVSSHDAGNVADTEMDTGSGAENIPQVGERRGDSAPPLPPQPAKKKRTRTLTTPHQSAVLHALLAQVCRPLRPMDSVINPA
jgi:hypothetical protein